MFPENDNRSGSGSRCCRGDTLNKGPDLRISGKALVEGADDYHKKINRQEDTQRWIPKLSY
jgi:hypothetical protein